LTFLFVRADDAKVQVFANPKAATDAKKFNKTMTFLRVGDLVGIVGNPGRTQTNELSIFATGTANNLCA
jgi:lysyl-tRNA synthetase class II